MAHKDKPEVNIVAGEDNLKNLIDEVMNSHPNDVTIISGDNEEVQTIKYLLTLFSPTLNSILSSLHNDSTTIILPDCSTSSIQHLVDILKTGEIFSAGLSLGSLRNINEVAAILFGQSKYSFTFKCQAKNSQNLEKIKIKKTSAEEKPQYESIFDVMDNLSNILDHKIKKVKLSNINVKEEFNIEMEKSNYVKDPDQQADITKKKQNITPDVTGSRRKTKIEQSKNLETKQKGNCYSCSQCDYKSILRFKLKLHFEIKHEGIRYFCDKCNYIASRKDNLNQHLKYKHEQVGLAYPCSQCEYKARHRGHLNQHIKVHHTQ